MIDFWVWVFCVIGATIYVIAKSIYIIINGPDFGEEEKKQA